MSRNPQSGLTLIELACALAIAGLLLSQAWPAMERMVQRQRLQSVAQMVRTDVQDIRGLAIRHGSNLQLHFESDADGICAIIHDGPKGACHCNADHQAQCTGSGHALKTQWLPASLGVRLASGADMRFAAGQGTVTPTTTLVLSNAHNDIIQERVSIAGRILACTPGPRFGGLPRCAS